MIRVKQLLVFLEHERVFYRIFTRESRWYPGIVGDRTKTSHSLRHSAVTSAIRQGTTLVQAQQMARHKSPETTMRYYHELSRTENPAEDLISYED